MDEATVSILSGFARHGLTALGGALASAGYIQSGQVSEFVGAGMCLAGIVWSWWNKRGQAALAGELARLRASANAPAKLPLVEVKKS